MKNILFICVILWTITGCSFFGYSSDNVTRPLPRIAQCYRGDTQACQDIIMDNKISCDYQYNSCASVVRLYSGIIDENPEPGVINVYDNEAKIIEKTMGDVYADLSVGERTTQTMKYAIKACLVGSNYGCKVVELIKHKLQQGAIK